jgi:predicted MPP superfamily phosphohydrolase
MIKKLFHFIIVLLLLALIIGVPGYWMLQRSYTDPEVHYYYTQEDRGDESLRFVVLSDLYNYVFEGGNGVIADLAGNTFPDAILIGGNMITKNTEEITPLTDLVKRLVQIGPVFYSYGEQELLYVKEHGSEGQDPLRDALEKAGAVVLNEEFTDASLYGVNLRIGGMYNNAYEMTDLNGNVKKRYEKTWEFLNAFQDTEDYKLMLSIRPESFIYADACDTWKVDLVASGNILGGLVVVPHYGGLFGGSQGYFPQYVHGMYDKGDVKIFITSGLSAPAGRIPRFNNPPEIAVVDVDGLRRGAAEDAAAQEQQGGQVTAEETAQEPEVVQESAEEAAQEPEEAQETAQEDAAAQ